MDNFKNITTLKKILPFSQKLKTTTCLCITRISGFNLVIRKTQTDFTAIEHFEINMMLICVLSLE